MCTLARTDFVPLNRKKKFHQVQKMWRVKLSKRKQKEQLRKKKTTFPTTIYILGFKSLVSMNAFVVRNKNLK